MRPCTVLHGVTAKALIEISQETFYHHLGGHPDVILNLNGFLSSAEDK